MNGWTAVVPRETPVQCWRCKQHTHHGSALVMLHFHGSPVAAKVTEGNLLAVYLCLDCSSIVTRALGDPPAATPEPEAREGGDAP